MGCKHLDFSSTNFPDAIELLSFFQNYPENIATVLLVLFLLKIFLTPSLTCLGVWVSAREGNRGSFTDPPKKSAPDSLASPLFIFICGRPRLDFESVFKKSRITLYCKTQVDELKPFCPHTKMYFFFQTSLGSNQLRNSLNHDYNVF